MTITTLRPTGIQFTSGSYVTSGAVPANTVTADDQDGTYLQGTAYSTYLALAVTNLAALPLTQRIKSCRARVRARAQAATGHVESVTIKLLRDTDATLSRSAVYTFTRTNSTLVTTSGPISYFAPGGVTWSQDSVNHIRLNVAWPSSGINEFIVIAELYVDVDINNQPYISGTPSVSNYTNNGTPTTTWTYMDADNDPQTRSRVKIFNSTQYGASNFDPELSSPDYDSGDMFGSINNVTTVKSLQNGVTYKSYVKVAQDWIGSQGALWWSTWVASVPFTVTFTPPSTPVINSAVVLSESNQYRALVNVLVPYTSLYLSAVGDFVVERGEYLTDDRGPAENWFHPQVAGAGSALRSAGYGFSVNAAQGALSWLWLDKTIPTLGDTPPGMLDWTLTSGTSQVIGFGSWTNGGTAYMVPVVQGQTHIFSFWAWVSTGSLTLQPSIQWRDATGATLISSTSGTTVTLTSTPQLVSVTGTPPGTAVLANGAALNVSSDITKQIFFTRLGFGLGTVPVDGRRAKGQPTGLTASGAPLGLMWKEIRSSSSAPAFAQVSGVAQTVEYPDYEIVPGRPTIYRASITFTTSAGVVVKSAYSNQVVSYAAPPSTTLLRSVIDPTLQVAVARRKQATFSIQDDAQVFHPLGADGGPVQVRDWVGGEDGQLIVITTTEAQSARLRDLMFSGDVLQVQWAQGGRTYLLVTDRGIDETISSDLDFCDADGAFQNWIRYRVNTLSYIETVAP